MSEIRFIIRLHELDDQIVSSSNASSLAKGIEDVPGFQRYELYLSRLDRKENYTLPEAPDVWNKPKILSFRQDSLYKPYEKCFSKLSKQLKEGMDYLLQDKDTLEKYKNAPQKKSRSKPAIDLLTSTWSTLNTTMLYVYTVYMDALSSHIEQHREGYLRSVDEWQENKWGLQRVLDDEWMPYSVLAQQYDYLYKTMTVMVGTISAEIQMKQIVARAENEPHYVGNDRDQKELDLYKQQEEKCLEQRLQNEMLAEEAGAPTEWRDRPAWDLTIARDWASDSFPGDLLPDLQDPFFAKYLFRKQKEVSTEAES